jgi:hypothetical protein
MTVNSRHHVIKRAGTLDSQLSRYRPIKVFSLLLSRIVAPFLRGPNVAKS